MSSARFEPDKILIHNNAFTSVPLVHSSVMGSKLLTLPNFLLHFKSKSTQMSSARFESDQILIHNNPFTSVPLVYSRVMGGKLLTLANFLLHFKAKSTQLSLARFKPDQILIHNNAFTCVPLVNSCVKVGKLLTLPNFLLYPIFYFISSQKAHNSLQRDLNETKLLHFKSKSTQMSSARFESDQILIHNNAFTCVPLVHSRVIGSKLLKLPYFLLHFKS